MEAGFFNNRVRLDLSVYQSSSFNQILNVDVSNTTGYSQKLVNAGRLNNKGIEVQLGFVPVKTAHFTWDVNANYAANRSKLKSLDNEGLLKNYVLGSDGSIQTVATVGRGLWQPVRDGFFTECPGTDRCQCRRNTCYQSQQQGAWVSTHPDWLGGITNTFTYDHLSLSVLIDGSFGGQSIFLHQCDGIVYGCTGYDPSWQGCGAWRTVLLLPGK